MRASIAFELGADKSGNIISSTKMRQTPSRVVSSKLFPDRIWGQALQEIDGLEKLMFCDSGWSKNARFTGKKPATTRKNLLLCLREKHGGNWLCTTKQEKQQGGCGSQKLQ